MFPMMFLSGSFFPLELHYFAIIGTFAAVVFVVGRMTTKCGRAT